MAAKVRDIASYSDARLIGEGGFGAVYRARDETHNRDVAIKVLPSELGDDERLRFERERQTMGLLGDHPFVITVHESGFTEEGEAYIVMEFASGGSLGERVRKSGPVPWAEAAKVMAAVADAVHVAHENGVLHRDIKPHNVLIDKFGQPKLADFGIAALASGAPSFEEETATTIAHASPELMRGEASTEASDIYALGSSVFALIKGTPAFFRPDDDSVAPMVERIQSEPPPNLRKVGIPDEVVSVIERAMAKDPADRYGSAGELAEALRASAAGQGPPTGPLTIAPEDVPVIGEATGLNGASSNGSGSKDEGEASEAPDDAEATTSNKPSRSGKKDRRQRRRRKSDRPRRPTAPAAKAESTSADDTADPESASTADADSSSASSVTTTDDTPDRSDDTSSVDASASSTSDDERSGDTGTEVADEDGAVKVAAASGVAVGEQDEDVDGAVTDNTDADGTAVSTKDEAGEEPEAKGVRKAGAPPLPPHHYQSLPDPDPEWSATRIAALGVALAALIATVAIATLLIRSDDTVAADGTATTISLETGESDDATGTGLGGQDGAASTETTVEVDCPAVIPIDVRVFCSIFTTNARSGQWHLPAFLSEPQPIEVIPGEYEIFVAPTNPEAVGDEFTLEVDVEGTDGETTELTHTFTVVDLYAEVECPDQVELEGSGVCRIVSYNATEGEWDIPRFGGESLREVPGEEAIFVEPRDAGSVGQTYEITVMVRNASGESYTASTEFEVIPAS